jgi:2,3-bisphosphoglycerate-dependent phosphoglycerate mutase
VTTPVRLCVVRHGETDWNLAGILQGWVDVPINDQGRRQARELATAFAGQGFDRVYSSPLIRALETAEIVAAGLGLPRPSIHEGLKERNFGVLQGVPKAELAEHNPLLLQQILQRNPAAHFESGETMDEVATRVLDAILDLAMDHPGEQLLVITHGWVMDIITRHISGLPRHEVLNMKRKNGEAVWVRADYRSIRAADAPGR